MEYPGIHPFIRWRKIELKAKFPYLPMFLCKYIIENKLTKYLLSLNSNVLSLLYPKSYSIFANLVEIESYPQSRHTKF